MNTNLALGIAFSLVFTSVSIAQQGRAAALAAWWEDPEFDPTQEAFYYIRVLKIPTPSWIAHDAKVFRIKPPEEALLKLQDRAYTSPIRSTP